MRWLEDERTRRLLLLGGGGLFVVIILWLLISAILPSEAPLETNAAINQVNKDVDGRKWDEVAKKVDDADERVAETAIKMLDRYRPPEASAAIHRVLNDPRVNVRVTAIRALPSVANPADFDFIRNALKDSNPQVRAAAVTASAVGEMREYCWDNVPELIKLLDDDNREVRNSAMLALNVLIGIDMKHEYSPDDAPAKRQKMMANLRQFLQRPGVSEHLKQYWATHKPPKPK